MLLLASPATEGCVLLPYLSNDLHQQQQLGGGQDFFTAFNMISHKGVIVINNFVVKLLPIHSCHVIRPVIGACNTHP